MVDSHLTFLWATLETHGGPLWAVVLLQSLFVVAVLTLYWQAFLLVRDVVRWIRKRLAGRRATL
jgi:hypothetical protein